MAPVLIAELDVGDCPDKDEIVIMHSLVAAHKTTLSRLIGQDDKPAEGLLLKKLLVLLATFRAFPTLDVVQKSSVSNMV